MAAGELRIRLLGGLEVEGVTEKHLGSRKARTLVKLLALARSAPVPADRIADALWPDDPPARPADQIGVLVSRLRPVLGAERIRRTDAGWSLAVDWLDVAELEARVDEAAARLSAGSHTGALAAARAALALVRGDLLLDEPDAPWAETDRASTERTIARARVLIAEAGLAAGQPADAAVAAEQALDRDPYDEAALRVLMRAHVAAGRPASALAAYARVRERLAEDLGVDPVDETEALHTAVLLGDLGPPAPRAVALDASPNVVGRTKELARLGGLLADTVNGRGGGIAVVEGEAGIGKTALLDAWLARVGPTALVIAGRCDELGRDLPLQPLLDGLVAHLRRLSSDDATAVLGDAAPVVGPLLGRAPVAPERRGPTTVSDPTAGQAMLFTSLLAVVERAAGDRATVVVVDDIHLAGPSTLEWLQFAVRRSDRLLVVASRRVGEGAPLAGAAVVSLGPLDLDAVAALVGAERAGELYARSGGHPLFLAELATSTSSDLPDSIRAAVIDRVEALGEAASTLRTAAVFGASVDVDVLAGVLDRSVPTLLEHIEAGLKARVVEERAGALTFRHEIVREALVADTTAARRAYIHREAARVLRDRPRHDALEIAWHAERGGDAVTAASALVEAAEIASARYDVAAAEDLLSQAITLHETPGAHLARARVRIARWSLDGARADARRALELGAGSEALEAAAWVEYYRRDYELAHRYAEEAVARTTDADLRASCLAMSGRVLHARGELAQADARLVEAVRIAPPAVRGFAQVWLAGLRTHQGEPDEAIELVDRAMVEHDWLGHPFARQQGWHFRMLALGHCGRVVETLQAAAAARQAAIDAGEPGMRFVAAADNVKSWVLRAVGRTEEAHDLSHRVFESTDEAAVAMNEMRCAAMLDLVDSPLLSRDLDATKAAIDRAMPVDTMHGTMAWHHRQRFGVQRARWHLDAGDPRRALELASGVVEDATGRGARRYALLAAIVAGRARAALGERLDHDQLDRSLAGLDRVAAFEAWWSTAELAAATGGDRWWRQAEHRAGALIGAAGEDAEFLRRWVAAKFSSLGRR